MEEEFRKECSDEEQCLLQLSSLKYSVTMLSYYLTGRNKCALD